MRRDGYWVDSWQRGRPPHESSESRVEAQVTEIIRSYQVQVLPILDPAGSESDRAFIEKNAIAALSVAGWIVDPPTSEWLGHHSDREAIRHSGLWNIDHVGDSFDQRFLPVLHQLVNNAISGIGAQISLASIQQCAQNETATITARDEMSSGRD